ncbi:MAG TPA: DUF3789 domain-containing protein [Clostridiales bacterium]|jgi:uncharacterized membrane protein YqgA involved in biofilm formation|nr:DUF3789 domain-containing protein [Clostridiales bacterium]
MHELIFFLIGLLLGGIIGIIVMCLMQINNLHDSNSHRKDDDE